jgi:hypothetical protein
MNYTILSAKFANEEHTAAVLSTAQAGDVLVSQKDTPALWALLPQNVAAYQAPVSVPHEVTMRQARLALAAAGKLAAVDAAIASLSEPQKSAAQIEWEYSAAVRRTQPLVLALAPAIGLSDEQLDALFIQAAAL